MPFSTEQVRHITNNKMQLTEYKAAGLFETLRASIAADPKGFRSREDGHSIAALDAQIASCEEEQDEKVKAAVVAALTRVRNAYLDGTEAQSLITLLEDEIDALVAPYRDDQ
jgi:hypothetical protein